jgi:tetratricopeptide (TPR) repeat protein
MLGRLVKREAQERPVILWLDDAHWSLDSLFFVLHLLSTQETEPIAVLIVLTCRSDLLAEQQIENELLGQILDMNETTSIPVESLDLEDRPRLVRELLGLEGDLAERVEARTAGNPLFAVQLVGDWVQRGILRPTKSGFQLKAGASLHLPDTIHEVWNDRIQRLLKDREPHEAETLEIAAMLGLRVDWGEWRTACQLRGARASLDLVEELVRSRLGEYPREHGVEGGWAFVHGMLRESLKRRAWDAGRAEDLHRVCARALAGRFGADAAARHTHHLLAAGDLKEAIEPLARTAEVLIEAGEVRRAARMLDERDDALDRLGVAPEAKERVESVLLRSYRARAEKELGLALELSTKAQEMSRALGSDRLLAEALRARGAALGNSGLLSESAATLQEAAELAAKTGDTRCLAASKRGRGVALTHLGETAEARHDLEDALKLYRNLGQGYGITVCLLSLSREAAYAEEWPRCQEFADEGLESARRLGFRSLVVDCLNQQGEASRGLGNLEKAEEFYSQAVRGASLLPAFPWVGILEGNRGLVLASLGRWDDARLVFRKAQVSLRRTDAKIQSTVVSVFLLPCLAAGGLWDEWQDEHTRATGGLAATGVVEPDLAKMASLAAHFARDAGRIPEARQALAIATSQWRSLGNEERRREAEEMLAELAG